jgi:hypothetical protein
MFSIGFPFPFKNNKSGSLFLFYKIESWKQIFISHLVWFWTPTEKIFTNTMMQGKKQSNAKKQRKIGALRWPPGQTSWLAGHDLWPPSPGQIPNWLWQLYKVCGDTWSCSYGHNLKLLKFYIFEVFSCYPWLYFIWSMITICYNIKIC